MVIIKAVDLFFQFLYFMVLVRVFMSFIPNIFNYKIAKFIYQVTDPLLEPFRAMLERFMPRGPGFNIDFSPIIALFVLNIFRGVIIRMLATIFL